ncbi:MAG: GNAT family N-acetyltransferase [Prevotellaceae bacterium]|jgi:GNAT superfamily N-acetyltransferase|nr:GNAT family N-acetyltransferase [Prevotellaceae bacterium]
MQIESYNRQELQEFIESGFYKQLDNIPISYHRALSQIHNPACDEEDTLLWAAYDHNSLVGYAGILPGMCRAGKVDKKIYWLSGFWVDESYRKKQVASLLFFPLIRAYEERLFITNIVPGLEKTYQRLGIFQPTVYRTGYRFYMQFCFSEIIVSRKFRSPFLKSAAALTDYLLNLPFSVRTLFYKKSKKTFHITEDSCFDENFQSLINSLQPEDNYIKKDATHFEWILRYPWILQGKQDEESQRYFFSSRSGRFNYCPLKVYEKEKLAGFVLLKIRDRALTVSYLYAKDAAVKDIALYLLEKAEREKLKTVTTSDKRLAGEISKNRIRYIAAKEIKRACIVTKKMNITSFAFQEDDGDSVFT